MRYSLRVTNTFERQLRRLSAQDRERVWKVIEEVQASPQSYKQLSGRLSGTRSARAGTLRLVYVVDESERRVILLYVGHREKMYE